jgi:hypothetical protein
MLHAFPSRNVCSFPLLSKTISDIIIRGLGVKKPIRNVKWTIPELNISHRLQ